MEIDVEIYRWDYLVAGLGKESAYDRNLRLKEEVLIAARFVLQNKEKSPFNRC